MAIGEVVRDVRKAAEMTQQEFGKKYHMSRSAVAMVELNERDLPVDVMAVAVPDSGCGFFAMEAAAKATGGYGWVGKLDGDIVDLSRGIVTMKSDEEMGEALEVNKRIAKLIINHPRAITHYDKQELEECLLQLVDVVVAASHQIAVICKEYSINWFALWRKHRQKLKAKGFMK